ncbi:MAG: hypothetical protein V4580_06280 [Bacteroidota bacterium]
MSIKNYLFGISIILNVSLYSQFKGTYQFPEKFSKSYFFDPVASYQKIKDYQITGVSKEDMDSYKIKSTYSLQRDFDNNMFYLEWYELENYLDKLVDSIIPADLKAKQKFTVFIRRNSNFDIEVLGNGFIFINIGTLSVCKNETELSFLLAHHIYHTFYSNSAAKMKAGLDALRKDKSNNAKYVDNKLNLIFVENFGLEMKADSFAYSCIANSKQNLNKLDNILNTLQYVERKSFTIYSKEFYVSMKNLVPSLLKKDTVIGRQKYLHQAVKNINVQGSNYIIDSVYFTKTKKAAREDCKKINMEIGTLERTLQLAFVDYLLGDGSPKNLFYIIESTRRMMYREPELLKKGFLAEDLQYTESFDNTNSSILKKPEYLFIDSALYNKAQKHPLINIEEKPFHTYEGAFWYFIKEAESKSLNEAQFSKALFYYSQKDEVKFLASLNTYLEKGGGIYSDFAENLNKYKMPYIKDGKTLVIIDHTTNAYGDNYYQSLDRMKYNAMIHQQFKFDSTKINLAILNEYSGTKPKQLNQYQKINNSIAKLYEKKDLDIFSKKRYLGKETMDERDKRNKFNKSLFVYNPDLFKWFSDEHYSGIFLQKINYQYAQETDLEERQNTYTISYCNSFDNRPFFWNSVRNNNVKKQTTAEMIKDARDFLFYKD